MFHRNPPAKTNLDNAIDEAISSLAGHEPDGDAYRNIVNQLAKLNEIRQSNKSDKLKKDTLVMVLGNIVGILVIVGYEHDNIVTSKALALVGKFRTN